MTRSIGPGDDRGAIMLIAVFFAIFAVALLYYLMGISSSVLLREKLQDAADSAALSTAIIHARGMNLIVLINIVMAAILSVLVTIKLLETLAIIGIGFAAALAWCTFGATLVAIPPLQAVQSSMNTAYGNLQPPIFDALVALHNAAGAVQSVTPGIADVLVEADLEANSEPPGTHGVAFGTRPHQDLPVQDDNFATLCGRAGEVPLQLVGAALSHVRGLSDLMDLLQPPMNDLTSQYSTWFCGDGSSAPPSYLQHKDVSYPRTDLTSHCESDQLTNIPDDPRDATSQACSDSQSDEQAAKADLDTGGCQAGHDCSLSGAYESHVALAREQCDPTAAPAPYEYVYQARSGQVDYEWTGKGWVRREPVYQQPSRVTSNDRPPCGPASFRPVVAEGYNRTVRNHADVSEVLPVCSNEAAPSAPPIHGTGATTSIVSFTEVLHILGCQRHETKQITMDNTQAAGNSGNDKSPKCVETAAKLGHEDFQIRAILHGKMQTSVPDRMMQLALWNQAVPDNPLSALRELGNYSFAQAEYFYAGSNVRSEWMWNMNWRARLRRFRLPTGSAGNALDTACHSLERGCGALVDQVKRIEKLIFH